MKKSIWILLALIALLGAFAFAAQPEKPALADTGVTAEPADPRTDRAPTLGTKLSFTALDLDGKEYTSEDLFGANAYTMVNFWGTWCGYCVREMGELAELHRRVQEKGCGIIGLEYEYGYDEATVAAAKKILDDNGVTYPNVLVNSDMRFMAGITGFPTSVFVDRDGVVVAPPIIGAQVSLYEPTFDSLLNAESEK